MALSAHRDSASPSHLRSLRARLLGGGGVAALAVGLTLGVACENAGGGKQAGGGDGKDATGFRTVPLRRGDLDITVEATGTLQPATQVEIGSRISGQMKRVLVDYNDKVTAGQLLAEIDPSPFRARQDEARASVASAKADVTRAQADLALKDQMAARAKDLNERGLNSVAELQAAVAGRDVAKAQVAVAEAQLLRATAALASATADVDATKIVSPIDGVVLARAVEPGATVAAALQAPRLFVIAAALDHLEVIAKVDEADLAIVVTGGKAEVTVDAFAGQTFEGVVEQIRIDPLTENGIVTFPVVVAVENKSGLLLPGMTATATIHGNPIVDALIVPSAALRFTPSTSKSKATGGAVWRTKKDSDGTEVAEEVQVKAKGRAGSSVEIEGEGLKVGDDIIVEERGAGRGGRRPPRIF